jgi:hypothetical protein
MINKKIILDVVHGDAKMNAFMHAADVFEYGKQLGELQSFEVAGDPDLDKLSENIKELFEKVDRNVSFVGIRTIDGVRVEPRPYIRPDTQSISDGHNFGLFKELLEALGYKVETTQYMQVTTVKLV